MGVFQHEELPAHSFWRQIYHPEVKGGTLAEARRGGQPATSRQVCFYVFSFLPFGNPGWGFDGCSPWAQVHKAVRGEPRPHV